MSQFRNHIVKYIIAAVVLVIAVGFVARLNNITKTQLVNRTGQTFETGVVVEILQDNLQADGTRVGQQTVVVEMTSGEKKGESLVLCCLWSLYADRLRSGSLSRTYLISVTDLRFELEKYGIRDQIDKSTMAGILALFSRFNLIDVNGKIGDEDCMIRLYASLQFALEPEEFQRFAQTTRLRMMEKTGEAAEDEEDDDEGDE